MQPCVGASLLAKNSQAPRSFRKPALSLTFFASKLAPTKRASQPYRNGNHDAKRAALDLDLLLISGAPSNHAGRNSPGIWGVNRQGCRFSRPAPWMARGGGPPNHWRITGTPSQSEVPSGGARTFWLLLGPSKSDPLSERNPKWPLPQEWICTPSNCVDCQSAFASKPTQLDCGASGR